MELNSISVLSFFSGGGFLDIGFEEAGFRVVWTNEIDPVFAKFYNAGISSYNTNKGGKDVKISNLNSIKDIDFRVILTEAFSGNSPKLFGVIGGPPCQDFSINGNLHGFKGDRGSLTDAYLYKILELQPSFFVMENVHGLLIIKKNRKHFLELLEIMREDYLVDFDVLNSLDFGVPQFRERVFVVGINKKCFDTNKVNIGLDGKWFPFYNYRKYTNAAEKFEWPAAVAYGGNPVKTSRAPLNLCVQSCLVPQEKELKVPNAHEYFKLYGDKRVLSGIKEGETNRPSFKRLHRYKYSPTACYGNNEVHLHPFQHRRLSVREALRIQGVPDSYVLPEGQLSKKFKMIGNGVPVPLATAVAKSLNQFIRTLIVKRTENGHLVKKEEKRGDGKDPVKGYKARNDFEINVA
jgi:DNA (cytosine-5)-methyltransferase 1